MSAPPLTPPGVPLVEVAAMGVLVGGGLVGSALDLPPVQIFALLVFLGALTRLHQARPHHAATLVRGRVLDHIPTASGPDPENDPNPGWEEIVEFPTPHGPHQVSNPRRTRTRTRSAVGSARTISYVGEPPVRARILAPSPGPGTWVALTLSAALLVLNSSTLPAQLLLGLSALVLVLLPLRRPTHPASASPSSSPTWSEGAPVSFLGASTTPPQAVPTQILLPVKPPHILLFLGAGTLALLLQMIDTLPGVLGL